MSIHPVEEAQNNFRKIMDEVSESHKPAIVSSERNSVVILAKEDWISIQETLHLLSIPGMGESIKEGMAIPIEECSEDLDW